jgi:hypothetical protein
MEAMYKKRVYQEIKNNWFHSPRTRGTPFFLCGMVRITLTIPCNKEYSIPQLKMFLNEIEQGIGRKITIDEWYSL